MEGGSRTSVGFVAMSTDIEEDANKELEKWLMAHYRNDLFEIRSEPVESGNPIIGFLGSLLEHMKAPSTSSEKESGEVLGKDVGVHLKLNLAGLNRMRMRKLQVNLVQRILQMRYHEREPNDWEDLLEKYSKLPLRTMK